MNGAADAARGDPHRALRHSHSERRPLDEIRVVGRSGPRGDVLGGEDGKEQMFESCHIHPLVDSPPNFESGHLCPILQTRKPRPRKIKEFIESEFEPSAPKYAIPRLFPARIPRRRLLPPAP